MLRSLGRRAQVMGPKLNPKALYCCHPADSPLIRLRLGPRRRGKQHGGGAGHPESRPGINPKP